MKLLRLLLPIALAVAACGAPPAADSPQGEAAAAAEAPRLDYAIAIHGGAGVIPKDMEEEKKKAYFDALEEALRLGRDQLDAGAEALDVVEQVVRFLEDSPLFNAGKGAVFTHDGKNELDAAVMDGRDLSCGAISGVTTVRNPVTLARKVMESSPHVFFTGSGAEQFADEMGVERVEPEYYFTQRRWDQLQKKLAEEKRDEDEDEEPAEKHGTVGTVALDRQGNLAAATSTGGMTNKRFGRVGDVPILGAGTYANNRTAAISCTGWGEKFIKNNVSHDVSAMMEYKGVGVREAAEAVIHGKLDPGDGGLIAVSHTGEIALVFNSGGMFRGAADATGHFEVKIWE